MKTNCGRQNTGHQRKAKKYKDVDQHMLLHGEKKHNDVSEAMPRGRKEY